MYNLEIVWSVVTLSSQAFKVLFITRLQSSTDTYTLSIPINGPAPAPHHLTPNLYLLIFPYIPHLYSHLLSLPTTPLPTPPPYSTFMPSTMSKPGKQLGQLLQEQQEPFILETYLLERGCLKKNLTSEGGFSCCHGNSSKLLKRSASCDLNMSGKGIPQCSKILRAIFNKLVSITGNPKSKLCDHDGGVLSFSEVGSSSQKVAEQDSFSSASTTTVFNSCSASDTEDSCASLQIHDPFSTATTIQALKQIKPREEEAATDRQVQGRSKNQRLQFGPISVLGDSSIGLSNAKTRKQENSSTRKSGFSNRVIQDSVSSASLLEVLVQSPTEKPRYSGVTELQELVWSNSSSRCFKSKRVLLQRKKLLFDCVREVVEGHGRNERREQSIGEFLGPEELEQLICQKIRAWEKQSGKETNINHLLNFDFIASSQEWNDLRPESRELGLDIGEAILEEMMSEIVTYMMNII